MSKKIKTSLTKVAVGMAAAGLALSYSSASFAAETEWAGFVENATYIRDGKGLSKFRNTAQAEFYKKLDLDGWRKASLNGVFRATYDGVYDLNDSEFGKDVTQPYLGSSWHGEDLSTSMHTPGTPFPCDNNPAVCNNLDGYMDQDENDAKFPEFNDQLDFVRELYFSAEKDLDSGTVFNVSFGKQQVIWGKSDLFRVLDIVNPLDYSRHNIFDELEDVRIPQWMLTAEWRFGPNEVLDGSNLSFVWNVDKFRPDNLGVCGQAYVMLDAGCYFSGYTFAPVYDFSNPGPPVITYNTVPNIHDVEEYDWSLENTQFGAKWEGVYGDLTFSLNAMHYRQQSPSTHFRYNPDFTPPAGPPTSLDNFLFKSDGVFDIVFPRVTMVGGAIDYYSMDMDAVWRLETAFTKGEELPRDTDGYKESDMLRYVIGFDKNLIMPSLGTSSAFFLSAQFFGAHILDHEADMPQKKDSYIATGLIQGSYKNNRLVPKLVMAHDFSADATLFNPSITWSPDNHWMFGVALNVKKGGDKTFGWSAAAQNGDTSGQTEPLARFLNGPLGVANAEDELQFTVRYSF